MALTSPCRTYIQRRALLIHYIANDADGQSIYQSTIFSYDATEGRANEMTRQAGKPCAYARRAGENPTINFEVAPLDIPAVWPTRQIDAHTVADIEIRLRGET